MKHSDSAPSCRARRRRACAATAALLLLGAAIIHRIIAINPNESSTGSAETSVASQISTTADSLIKHDQRVTQRGIRETLQRDLAQRLAEARPFDELNGNSVPPSDSVRAFLESVARTDPELALELIDRSTTKALMRYKMAAIVAELWGATDPQAAWQWVRTSAARWEFEEKQPLFVSVLDGMARTQPQAVVNTITASLQIDQEAGGREQSALTFNAVQALVRTGAEALAHKALMQWSRDLPPERLNPAAISLVVTVMARRSPADMAAWLETLPPSEGRRAGLDALAATWGETSPRTALQWASQLPDEDGRATAVQRVFNAWQEQDSPAAMEWIVQNEADPTTDKLISDLVSKPAFRAKNPEAAVQLAELIRDDATRLPALQSAILAWGTRDLSAALSYIETAPHFSDTQKTQIIASLRQHADFGFY